jgi:Mn2+/Fe2+ NRAMP family transporter
MLEKTGILFIILILLLVFYLVIRLGAGKKKDIAKSQEITGYLRGIRILIIILAIVALILWFFLN